MNYEIWINWLAGAAFGASVFYIVQRMKSPSVPKHLMDAVPLRSCATKDNEAQVELHIARQRHLGERMIGDNDQPSRWELIVTVFAMILLMVGTLEGWW